MIIPNAASFNLRWYYFVNKFLIDDMKKVSEGKKLTLRASKKEINDCATVKRIHRAFFVFVNTLSDQTWQVSVWNVNRKIHGHLVEICR